MLSAVHHSPGLGGRVAGGDVQWCLRPHGVLRPALRPELDDGTAAEDLALPLSPGGDPHKEDGRVEPASPGQTSVIVQGESELRSRCACAPPPGWRLPDHHAPRTWTVPPPAPCSERRRTRSQEGAAHRSVKRALVKEDCEEMNLSTP